MAKTAKPVEAAKTAKPVEEYSFGEKLPFQEWDVKVTKGSAEKLKIKRGCVKITEEQAEILNTGILSGSNTYGVMYFLPE
jgi:hypothetical protein